MNHTYTLSLNIITRIKVRSAQMERNTNRLTLTVRIISGVIGEAMTAAMNGIAPMIPIHEGGNPRASIFRLISG